MSALIEALIRTAGLLDRGRVPYMVVGGLANAVWGEPRATLDVDVTVWVADDAVAGLISDLAELFSVLPADPVAFCRETRVIPVQSSEGVRVDVILGLLPFEHEAISRAIVVEVEGHRVRFISAEDLILMKSVSDRDRDIRDAGGIVLRRMAELDVEYLEPRLQELARLLDRPEIVDRWIAWKCNAGQRG